MPGDFHRDYFRHSGTAQVPRGGAGALPRLAEIADFLSVIVENINAFQSPHLGPLLDYFPEPTSERQHPGLGVLRVLDLEPCRASLHVDLFPLQVARRRPSPTAVIQKFYKRLQ